MCDCMLLCAHFIALQAPLGHLFCTTNISVSSIKRLSFFALATDALFVYEAGVTII
jgi:hypothetical protein